MLSAAALPHRVVILGAGYAGLGAATRLAALARRRGQPAVDITLIDRKDEFVERVRLHQVAVGQSVGRRPLAEVLAGRCVRLVVGEVTDIDLGDRSLTVAGHAGSVTYDSLVYALGSDTDLDSVPGARQHAFAVGSLPHALHLHSQLETLPAGGSVVVVGGGLTGIEAVAEIAEARPSLHTVLLSGVPVGDWLSSRAQRAVRLALDRLGVEVLEGQRVAQVRAHSVLLQDGAELASQATVWSAGFRVPDLAMRAGLAVDGRGRMIVDDSLRSVSHPEVYGIGDAACCTTAGGGEARMSCQTGLPMGQYAAKSIARSLREQGTSPIRIRYVWQNISLGRRHGVTQLTRLDDSSLPLALGGAPSALFKEAVTRGAAWATTR